MVVQCPHCPARLNIPTLPSADTPIRCPRCAAVFTVAPPADEVPAAAPVEELLPEPVAEAAEPVAEAARRPEDDFSWDDSESTPAAPPKQKTTRRAAPPDSKFPWVMVGGVILGIAVVVGLVFAFSGGDKPKDTATRGPDPVAQKKDAEKNKEKQKEKEREPKKGPPPVRPTIPAEFADLFTVSAERPAPTVQLPVLKRAGTDDLTVPTFNEKPVAPPESGKLTIEEVKQATAYIKVIAGATGKSGSGFVVRVDSGALLVATNNHVIAVRDETGLGGRPQISVVFDSGLPTEWEAPGEVTVTDQEHDLALVRVAKPQHTPRPIDPELAPKVTELMEVRICGFPFGSSLATGNRNPNITIGKGAVSSLRTDEQGRLAKIQIDGAINPGNSGGPVVDVEGRLVGVTVSRVRDSGFGFAIPSHLLSALLGGRAAALVAPAGFDGKEAAFRVLAPFADPAARPKTVALHALVGDAAPAPEPDPAGGWKPVAGATKFELNVAPRFASGEFKLPVPAKADKPPVVVLQLECQDGAGKTVFSRPVPHKLTFDTVRTASDALPLDEFARNVERYAGQVAVVRGRMVPGTPHRGAAYEMFVTNDMNTRQDGLLFLADRELATQFNELETERQSLPARLTVRVGKRGTDGTTPVRITHIDFIGAGSRITRSIPSAEESDDPLVMLNRKPEKYVGQRVVVLGLLSPSVSGPPKEPELSVLFLSEQRPEHLHFTTTPEMAAKLSDAKTPHGFYIAKLTLHVEDKELDGVGPRIVNVVKMELLDRRGEPFKTIE